MRRTGPTIWSLLTTPPAPGAWNMSVDEALLQSVRAGGAPTLRFYRWSPPCLSLGRNQPARDAYPAAALAALGLDVVRRPTGGRAVLHDEELTYSVALPDHALGSPRRAHRLINRVFVESLRQLGVAADLAPRGASPAPLPSTAPCFAEPVAGEVLTGGRKLIGSAQVRSNGVLLQHGSLPLRRSGHLDALREAGCGEIEGSPAYLETALGRPSSFDSIIAAMIQAWKHAVGPLEESVLTVAEYDHARQVEPRFTADEWTWRR